MGLAFLNGNCEKEKKLTLWEATQYGDQPRWKDHKVVEKSAAAGLRRAKQSESSTDHLHHCLRHHSLRFSGGGWALRFRLWRSLTRRGLELAVQKQPAGLRSRVSWTGEQNSMACREECYSRGNVGNLVPQEKQGATVGEGERRGADNHRQALRGWGTSMQATSGERPLTWAMGDQELLVWDKGRGG